MVGVGIIHSDRENIFIGRIYGQFRTESRVSSFVPGEEFSVQENFRGMPRAVDLKEKLFSGTFRGGEAAYIPAAAAIIIIAAVLSVHCVPGMGKRDHFPL